MEGFIFSQSGQTIQEILTYVEQRLPGTLQALEKAIRDETTRATNKENELLGAIGGLIPKSEKGAANGVASLNGGGQVPNDQLQWSLRGVLNPSDIDKLTLTAGIYQVNGKILGPGILDGEQANGVLLQFPWDSRVQVLYVGRAAGAAAGEQVEIYTRRYLPTPKRWTAWSKAGGGSGGEKVLSVFIYSEGGFYKIDKTIEEIKAAAADGAVVIGTYQNMQYVLSNHLSGVVVFYSMVSEYLINIFSFEDQVHGELYQVNLSTMTHQEAATGTEPEGKLISAKVLKDTMAAANNLLIVNGDGMEASHSSTEIAAAVTAGKMPVLKVGNKFFLLYSISGNAVFRRMDGLNIVAEYEIDDQKQILEPITENSIGQIEDVHILSPQEGQVLVYFPEHEEEEMIVPAGWYNRTLSYPSMSQYEALVARVAALEQNQ